MLRKIRRLVLATLGVTLLIACDDSPTAHPPIERRPDEPGAVPTGDVLVTPRLAVDLRASGAFRPGAPVVITATAQARYNSANVDYDLLVLDDDGTVDARERGLGRGVASFRGPMGRGAQRQLTATVTFSRPGYYRVAAVARNRPAGTDPLQAADSVLIDLAAQTLYLLIDEQGGRLTSGYDAAALVARRPAYGAFGPFVPGRGSAGGASSASRQAMANAVGGRHRLLYENLDLPLNPDGSVALSPVPGARIVFDCLNTSFVPVSKDSIQTAADGTFTVPCASGYYNAAAYLRSTTAHVLNPDRSNAAVDSLWEFSDTDLRVKNGRGGHVQRLLYRYVPIVQQRFGLTRGQLTVLVNNNTSVTTPTRYDPNVDVVEQNHDAVFGEVGRFTTMHEYGHAYHYKAVEPWAVNPNYCNGGPHTIDGVYEHNCAFVEGFADFFASWIAADSLFSHTFSDYQLETHRWYSGVDGSKVEGAFAGFLYDLVDGPGDPDAANNSGPIEDVAIVDGVSYPGSFLVNTMRLCTLADASGTYSKLYGTYDMVYCLENSLTPYTVAQSFGYTWRRYSSVARNVTAPAGYNVNIVRSLWRANFYGA